MTDEWGEVEYEYNALSQLTAETRQFNVSMPSAPLANNKFKIQYDYSLSTLKSYTDPFGQQVSYGRDDMGRATGITGSSFGGVTTYGQDAERRAWGGLKAVTYTGGTDLALTYNSRLKVASMGLQKADSSYLMNKSYEYYKDGKIKVLDDAVDARFDRLNTYDHRGLISEAFSGGEARGETVAPENRSTDLPYRQTFAFNAFGHMTASTNMHWGETEWNSVSFDQENEFENDRIQKPGWEFDADGRNTKSVSDSSEVTLTTFDAAGRVIERNNGVSLTRTYYDGNGAALTSTSTEEQKFLIRSSLLNGQVVSQVWGNGKKYRSYVRGIGNQTAVQTAYATSAATLNESVTFEYSDALSVSYRTTDKNAAAVATGDGGEGSPIETDPLGGSVGTSSPYLLDPIIYEPVPGFPDLQPFPSDGPQMPGQDFWSLYSFFGSRVADLPGFGTNWGSQTELALQLWDESMWNGWLTGHYVPNEQLGGTPGARLRIRTLTGGTDGQDDGPDGIPGTEDDNIYTEVEDTVFSWEEGRGLDWVDSFFASSPNCEKVFKNLLKDRYEPFVRSLKDTVFIDARDPVLLGQTLESLGIPSIDNDGRFTTASGTLGDVASRGEGALAVASPDRRTAYLLPKYYESTDARANLRTKFHEAAHNFFRANHIGLLAALSLPRQVASSQVITEGGPIRDASGKIIGTMPRMTLDQTADQNSSSYFDKWLENDCK